MPLFNNYLFRYVVLVFYLCLCICVKSFSQTIVPSSNIDHDLLAINKKVINSKLIPVIEPCSIPNNLTFEDLLEKVRLYNADGNWQCSKAILLSINKKEAELTALQLCRYQLAQAGYYTLHQSFDSANVYATLANKQAGANKWKNEKAQALLLLSAIGVKLRNISSAYAWADSALIFARESGNENLEGKILLQLALCARRHFTAIAKRSFPYYLMAREKSIATADSLTLANIDLFLATDNFELGKWNEGLPYFKEGIELSLHNNDVNNLFKAYIALGYSLTLKEHLSEALSIFRRALQISQQQQQPYNIQGSYHQISDVFHALKQYDSALVYANLSANVARVDSFWANMWDTKASIYEDLGNYKMASAMYKKSINWYREDFLYRNQDQLNGYEAKLNTKEKELQVTREKKRALQLKWMIGGVGGLLLISGWAFAVQRNAKQRLFLQNNLIQKQRSELERSLGEKEILLKEIHHRVKNNLSVISSLLELQSSGMQDEKARAAIAVGQNRVSSIALIHQRLYQHENLAAIELGGFLQDLLRQVSSIFKKPDTQIKIDLAVPETLLDIDTAVPLGLIMNELLTNSYKYAFDEHKEGLIKIDLKQQKAGEFILTYADNGPGIGEDINITKTTSLGLRLIHRLSKQVGGSATYVYNNGSTFKIYFKDSITRNQEA